MGDESRDGGSMGRGLACAQHGFRSGTMLGATHAGNSSCLLASFILGLCNPRSGAGFALSQ